MLAGCLVALAFCLLGDGVKLRYKFASPSMQQLQAGALGQMNTELARNLQEWDGLDSDGYDLEGDTLVQSEGPRPYYDDAHKKHIQILGLQNTGTNLLASLMRKNFGQMLMFHDWSIAPGSIHKDRDNRRPGIWKHTNIKEKFAAEPDTITSLAKQGVVPLMMVRNPLSWLESMRKAPYELKKCVTGDTWLTRPCRHQVPCGYKSACKPKTYPSLADMWNEWNMAFTSFEENGFRRGLVIRYESLVFNSTEVLDRIGRYLALERPEGGLTKMRKAAKTHGHSLGRVEALKKIKNKEYMHNYTPAHLASVCGRLDIGLQKAYSYRDCKGV